MTRLFSLGVQLEQLASLRDTGDLADWESDFVGSVVGRYRRAGERTSVLSESQVEKISEIWQRNCA
jgi:hypothetical protein